MSVERGRVRRARSGHGPDWGRSGDRLELAALLEPEGAVERARVGERRLQVAGDGVLVCLHEDGRQDRAAESAPLLVGVYPDKCEIPVRVGRMAGSGCFKAGA